MKWALGVIGWSPNRCADRIGMGRSSIAQMLTGKRFIPETLGEWLETLAKLHLTFSKPLGWGQHRPREGENDDVGAIPLDSGRGL